MLTAYEAMGRAIADADTGDLPRAQLWLDIARELREGSRQPTFAALQRKVDEGYIKLRTSDTQKLEVPVTRPGDAVGAVENCVHCGYAIAPEEPNAFGVVGYVHTRTGISTCPVKMDMAATDQTFVQTWAEPPRDWSSKV